MDEKRLVDLHGGGKSGEKIPPPLPFDKKDKKSFSAKRSPEQKTPTVFFFVFVLLPMQLAINLKGCWDQFFLLNFLKKTLGPTFSTEKPQKPRS